MESTILLSAKNASVKYPNGVIGMQKSDFEIYDSPYIETSTISLNIFITLAALVVGFAQLVFLYNIILSARAGKPSPKNPL